MFRWIKQKLYGQPTDRQQAADERQRANTLNAVIQYALSFEVDEGLEWLRDWNEGDPDAIKELKEYQYRPGSIHYTHPDDMT